MADCLWSWAKQKSSKHGILHVRKGGSQSVRNEMVLWRSTWFPNGPFSRRPKVPVCYPECNKSLRFLAMMGLERWKEWLQLVHFLNLEKQISPVGPVMDQTGNDLQLTSSGFFYCSAYQVGSARMFSVDLSTKKVGRFRDDSNLDPGIPLLTRCMYGRTTSAMLCMDLKHSVILAATVMASKKWDSTLHESTYYSSSRNAVNEINDTSHASHGNFEETTNQDPSPCSHSLARRYLAPKSVGGPYSYTFHCSKS